MGSIWQIPEQNKGLDAILIDYAKASESVSRNGNPEAPGTGEGTALPAIHREGRGGEERRRRGEEIIFTVRHTEKYYLVTKEESLSHVLNTTA